MLVCACCKVFYILLKPRQLTRCISSLNFWTLDGCIHSSDAGHIISMLTCHCMCFTVLHLLVSSNQLRVDRKCTVKFVSTEANWSWLVEREQLCWHVVLLIHQVYCIEPLVHWHEWFTRTESRSSYLLWSPYVIGQTIIFSSCSFFLLLLLLSSFFFLA